MSVLEEDDERGPEIVPVSVAVPVIEPASLAFVGIFHSRSLLCMLKVASPREGRSSVTLRTGLGKGIVTLTESRVGADVVPVVEGPNEKGEEPERVDEGPELLRVLVSDVGRVDEDVIMLEGPDCLDVPGKLVFKVTLASKSSPEGPRPVRRSTVAGRKSFPSVPRVGRVSESKEYGSRSTS